MHFLALIVRSTSFYRINAGLQRYNSAVAHRPIFSLGVRVVQLHLPHHFAERIADKSSVRARLNEEKTTGLSPTSRMMEFASQGPPGLRLLRRLGWPVWPYLQRWSGWPLISWWAPSLGYVAEYAGTPGSSSTSDSARILGDSDPLQVIDGSIVRTSGRLDPFFARFV
ncbi:uncharacterized protein LOC143904347 isoform X1 [Temnothorax americanus]|uniref:uncharacterized protein LOC143904347 isoform X1 n=1 Tax=Temnothorax americanus TaxID=1964332 RepID=UPI004068C677